MKAGIFVNVIYKLKEFYVLEVFQLTLYKSQMDAIENEYVKHVYERIIELERHHIDFYKETLHQYGENTPVVPGNLTALAGNILGGVILDLTTAENRYKLGIAVENKAIEMYRDFIIMVSKEDPDLCKRLWHNMIDEELHLLWFKDNLKHIASQEPN